jgi:hypothetical protein
MDTMKCIKNEMDGNIEKEITCFWVFCWKTLSVRGIA